MEESSVNPADGFVRLELSLDAAGVFAIGWTGFDDCRPNNATLYRLRQPWRAQNI